MYFVKRGYYLKALKNLCLNINVSNRVYTLALFYLDTMLTKKDDTSDIEVIVIACFLVAGKFYWLISAKAKLDETRFKIPKLKKLKLIDNSNSFDVNEIKKQEFNIIKALDYKILFTTSYNFLDVFLKYGVIFEDETDNINNNDFIQKKIRSKSISTLDYISKTHENAIPTINNDNITRVKLGENVSSTIDLLEKLNKTIFEIHFKILEGKFLKVLLWRFL